METPDTSYPISGWLPLTRQLVESIADLFELHASQHGSSLDNDYVKLLNVAQKLEEFSDAVSGGKALSETRLWHDLRNYIGTIMGYAELMQEELDSPGALDDNLGNILRLCRQVLEQQQVPHSTSGKRQRPVPKSKVAIGKAVTGTILIVDDQAESREILMRYLQQDEHRVLQADGGSQMFEILGREDVDLILLDLILPEMDGDELLQGLKQDEALRAIPVIVVSGNKETDRVIRCIEAGAEDYLFKPFNPVLLKARINAGVERKRWHNKEQKYRKDLERNERFIRSIFGRYLSKEIVSTLLENPDGLNLGGVQRKVSVLMADIRGFTSIAEQLTPQRVVRLLNNYLGTMSEIIMRYNGTVDEFIGDAILAIFGAPISRDDDTDRAIRCALEMQAVMADINARNRAENLPEIEMGISINTGPVVAGNIGSEKRAKYGVVGHTVNQTARIEEHCKAGSILISEATLTDAQSTLCIGNSKTIQAKGLMKTIKIFELTDISPETDLSNC